MNFDKVVWGKRIWRRHQCENVAQKIQGIGPYLMRIWIPQNIHIQDLNK